MIDIVILIGFECADSLNIVFIAAMDWDFHALLPLTIALIRTELLAQAVGALI